jgi:hypothetical protein
VSKEDHRAAAEHVLRPGGAGATWRGEERASGGWGSGGADAGAAHGARKGSAEAVGAWHMASEGSGGGTEKKQRS